MDGIARFMEDDHDRLDGLFERFKKGGDDAASSFAEFASGLRRHIGWEEELLFPPFEALTGMADCGPTAVMREEHRMIKQVLGEMEGRLPGSPEKARALAPQLLGVLGDHNIKEEQILYPWLDSSLGQDEIARVRAAIGIPARAR